MKPAPPTYRWRSITLFRLLYTCAQEGGIMKLIAKPWPTIFTVNRLARRGDDNPWNFFPLLMASWWRQRWRR
ncbi:hypothetical protein KCP76_08750 [Salmonella enterica subsp. enterica serovar Weltevreden]|nr:hypothetical protein KCP76_08750 [Salmonella enterica subsp. enterica serovar Weltevreden]